MLGFDHLPLVYEWKMEGLAREKREKEHRKIFGLKDPKCERYIENQRKNTKSNAGKINKNKRD